ncbi:hypothetical protein [Acinetobacter pittii]|uniref:hypothetical protein n=1 Tax=Acinetobacter pittii TaxID=48296 RepID=UPI00237FE77B|nr:hypothetical protein [Acinetobacter pittii]MDE4038305.1 hypothetical protein [Acinetobacter pittii]WPP88970.1 hypothetical protein SOI77_02760 [Acinetobacter pittii]
MDYIKLVLDLVSLPPSLTLILKWLVGLVLIDRLLEMLTKNKFSLEKIVKGTLIGVCKNLQHREGVEPLKINRKIRKFFAYTFCGSMGYGCVVFSALLIWSLVMMILTKGTLPLDKEFKVWGIILILGLCARFAYVETRAAYKNAKSI